jgi:hypothetical protein
MSAPKKPKEEELEPIAAEPIEPEDDEPEEGDEDDGDDDSEIDLDDIEPEALWNALARYTTEMVEDDEWVDPELLSTYSIVLSNLAQIVAKLVNEPEQYDEEEEEDDTDVS